MRLWKRAAGALKDQNSIWVASLARRTALRNPDIEAAVIKATSHDEFSVDYRNAERVYKWIRLSPSHLKPLVWSITMRMEKTRSWVVALKGLMLMHGIFSCRTPAVQRIGRLPFDLSNFEDRHSAKTCVWSYNAFIRAYYAFLDHKSTLLSMSVHDRKMRGREDYESSLLQDLVVLQKLQGLLDMILLIKPQFIAPLIVEAMDCVVIEIYDVYSRICSVTARVLSRICLAGNVEAALGLRILQKAKLQGKDLELYFEFCRDIGVMNATECPKVVQIPEEEICELENMVNAVSERSSAITMDEHAPEQRAIVVREQKTSKGKEESRNGLKTIITDKWETFDEAMQESNSATGKANANNAAGHNPFEEALIPLPAPLHHKNDACHLHILVNCSKDVNKQIKE